MNRSKKRFFNRAPRAALAAGLLGLSLFEPLGAKDLAPQLFDLDRLKLVDEVDCAATPPEGDFRQYPADASKVETILGRKCRVLSNDSNEMKYFAYNIGKGKGLKAGAAYLLVVEYPEDKPRAMYILNRGNETGRGLATGSAVADTVFGKYVNSNAESIQYPLSDSWQSWQQFFYLHDRFPEFASLRGAQPRPAEPKDGFWVVIAQNNQADAAGSAGAAAGSIRLYEVPDPERYDAKINYPPDELPKRYIFCREEMADGVVSVPHGKDDPSKRGFDKPLDWFEQKARNMLFLGMNTFTKDLLEFGHNQGWDAKDNNWYVPSSTPDMWADIVGLLSRKYPSLYVLPYYEYGGATAEGAVGHQRKPVKLLGDNAYTHLDWINKNAHVDILDPAALEDAKRLLDATILDFKSKANFVGAWFRPRPVQMPISFSDENLALYKKETGNDVSRDDLQKDKEALAKYYDWWLKKRHQFVAELAQYLRNHGLPEAVVLLTIDTAEPGISLPGDVFVTDDPRTWQKIMRDLPKQKKVVAFDPEALGRQHAEALKSPHGTWAPFEWNHACPWADPANFQEKDGTVLTYTFNRLYTVSSPGPFSEFRSGDGLAAVRHHSLNENSMDDKIGYFACDAEPAGPYSMLAEARAMAYGDPRFLGYLISNTLARGYPQYARAFNQAFLALPALPSKIVANAAEDDEIVVREIDAGQHGTYLAVINVGLKPKERIGVRLPKAGAWTNAATGAPLADGGQATLDFYPGQMYALRLGGS